MTDNKKAATIAAFLLYKVLYYFDEGLNNRLTYIVMPPGIYKRKKITAMRKSLICFYCMITIVQTTPAQPLQLLSSNPHYFLYQNKPLVIVGSGEHYGSVMNTAFNYDKYLQRLHNDGLNTTRLFMGAYYE
ncbi:MAG: hypothetical protein ACXVNN_10125, partial [Bacteroidia bacterium]